MTQFDPRVQMTSSTAKALISYIAVFLVLPWGGGRLHCQITPDPSGNIHLFKGYRDPGAGWETWRTGTHWVGGMGPVAQHYPWEVLGNGPAQPGPRGRWGWAARRGGGSGCPGPGQNGSVTAL